MGTRVAGSVSFSSGNTVATFTPSSPAGGEHHVYGDGVGGAECLGHADERPVFVEFHHRWAAVSVQYLAGRRRRPARSTSNDPTRRPRACSSGPAAAGTSPVSGSTRRSTTPVRISASLWSSTGTLLATGTFSNETASGWQELDFSSPVAVTAGTTYVASYFYQYRVSGVHRAGAGVGGDQRAADRAGRWRGVRLWVVEHVPDQHLQQQQLLGRRGVLAVGGRLPRRRCRRYRRPRGRPGPRCRWRRRRRSPSR